MRERVVLSKWGARASSALLAAALLAPAAPAAARGLGAQRARALADTIAAYNAKGQGANVQIGQCARLSIRRTDCENLRVSSTTGATTCESVTAMFKLHGRLSYARYFCPLATGIGRPLRRHRVPGAVLRALSVPPEIVVSCPAGLPGCPDESGLPRCPAAPAPCPPVVASFCATPSASCPEVSFGRCPADRGACPPREASPSQTVPDCVADPQSCGTPLIDCANEPLLCGPVPTHPCTGPLDCAAAQQLLGCATGATLCSAVVTAAQSRARGRERLCWYVPRKVIVRRPPPKHKRVHESRYCRTI